MPFYHSLTIEVPADISPPIRELLETRLEGSHGHFLRCTHAPEDRQSAGIWSGENCDVLFVLTSHFRLHDLAAVSQPRVSSCELFLPNPPSLTFSPL